MKRGNPLKRSAMKRRPLAVTSPEEKAQKAAFRAEARFQRCCQVCGSIERWDAHHVIERQYLRINGFFQWDPADALRVCDNCHRPHTLRVKPIPLTALTDRNIDYAIDLLGAEKAVAYLHDNYAGTDPRLDGD